MRRPGGYAHWFNGDIGVGDKERDTFTCPHCNGVVFVEPFAAATESGGWCGRCAKPICKRCAAHGECIPFELMLDATGR